MKLGEVVIHVHIGSVLHLHHVSSKSDEKKSFIKSPVNESSILKAPVLRQVDSATTYAWAKKITGTIFR